MRMKIEAFLAVALLTFLPGLKAQTAITAADIASHLGIRFWRIPEKDLPEKYSAAILEIKDGKIVGGYTSHVRLTEPGDLVIGAHTNENGLLVVSVSRGRQSVYPGIAHLKKIGISASRDPAKVELEKPMALAGDYFEREGMITISGRVEDIQSGIAVKIMESRD